MMKSMGKMARMGNLASHNGKKIGGFPWTPAVHGLVHVNA